MGKVAKGHGAMKKEPKVSRMKNPQEHIREKTKGLTRTGSDGPIGHNASGKVRHTINNAHEYNTMPHGYKGASCRGRGGDFGDT
jgi:hypothetical protein